MARRTGFYFTFDAIFFGDRKTLKSKGTFGTNVIMT